MGLSKFGKLFFEEVEETNENQPVQTVSAQKKETQAADSGSKTNFIVDNPHAASDAAAAGTSAIDPASYKGKSSETYIQMLCESIRENDIEGPDYLEIRETVFASDLKNIPDVTTRWKTAFSMIKVLNKTLTKQHVLDSIDVYCKVIDNEQAAALKQFDQKYQDTIVSKEKELENMKSLISADEKQIESLRAQIAQIENKISGNRQFIADTEREISAAKVDIFVKQQDLKASAEQIKNNMLDDKKLLTDVLPND